MAADIKTDSADGARRRGIFVGALAGLAALVVGRSAPAAAADGDPLVGGKANMTTSPTDLMYEGAPEASALRVMSGNEAALLGAGSGDIARAVPLNAPIRAGAAFVGKDVGAAALSKGTVAFLAVQGEVMGEPVDVLHNPAAGWFRSDMGSGSVGISMGNIGVAAVSGGPWLAPQVEPTALWARGFGDSCGIESETDRMPAIMGESGGSSGVIGMANTGGYGNTGATAATGEIWQTLPGIAGVFGVGGGATAGTWGLSDSGTGAWGQSSSGVGVLGQVGPVQLPAVQYPASGVLGIGNSGQPGTWGMSRGGGIGAWGISDTGPGVVGQTGGAAPALGLRTGYPPTGVYGIGIGDKTGVWGVSDSGTGEWGQSSSGVGVLGQTGPVPAGAVYPRAGVLGVDNVMIQPGPPNLPNAGTWGLARGDGIGAWGQSNTGIGVSGESGNIGAWFKKGMVRIDPKTLEPAALHTTALGTDVSGCFRAEMGVAVMAEAKPGGFALMAHGRMASSFVDTTMVFPMGATDFFVACAEISEMSHVDVTLKADIGAQVQWVEIQPGKGFVIHLDKRSRVAGGFSYSMIESAAHHE